MAYKMGVIRSPLTKWDDPPNTSEYYWMVNKNHSTCEVTPFLRHFEVDVFFSNGWSCFFSTPCLFGGSKFGHSEWTWQKLKEKFQKKKSSWESKGPNPPYATFTPQEIRPY